jgi:cation transport ATPase
MESVSTHPIANAIVKHFGKTTEHINSQEIAGKGVSAVINGSTYYFGSLSFIKDNMEFEDEA